MLDRRITDKMDHDENALKAIISENTTIKGNMTGNEEVILHGKFNGKMNLNSLLFVKITGNLKGMVKTENMIIEGEVEGEIVVQNKIEVRASGRFNGELICKQIAIEEGAFFQGNISMESGQEVSPTYFKEKRKELQEM
jgi:cytoskeletal protein CcmA (bactofilin family)